MQSNSSRQLPIFGRPLSRIKALVSVTNGSRRSKSCLWGPKNNILGVYVVLARLMHRFLGNKNLLALPRLCLSEAVLLLVCSNRGLSWPLLCRSEASLLPAWARLVLSTTGLRSLANAPRIQERQADLLTPSILQLQGDFRASSPKVSLSRRGVVQDYIWVPL